MLHYAHKMAPLGLAALIFAAIGTMPTTTQAEPDVLILNDDLTEPTPGRSRAAGAQRADKQSGHTDNSDEEFGAIGGSVEERFAKFQAEKQGRVKHFQDVVNRNHMKKYGVKVR